MEKLLGANWRTTLWGSIFAVSTAIAIDPHLIEVLPDSMEGYVRMIAGLIVASSGVGLAVNIKDKHVTGGTVQQTASGDVAQARSSTSVAETHMAQPK